MWKYDALYQKSRLYIRRALETDHFEDSQMPFWGILSLELLARATLAKVHPALLADPKEGDNILFACGFPGSKSPVSIPAKTVFHRCTVICPDFTKSDYDQCMIWLNWRNEEIHTGGLPLVNLKTGKWQPNFYRICSILLEYNKETLEDFLGRLHANTAREMIKALDETNKQAAFDLVREAKNKFQILNEEERTQKLNASEETRSADWDNFYVGEKVNCPACQGAALVVGDLIKVSSPKDIEGEFIQEEIRLPVKFKCYSCGLTITGHQYLHALDLGDQYSRKETIDPKEYYGIEFDPSDYYDEDYGND